MRSSSDAVSFCPWCPRGFGQFSPPAVNQEKYRGAPTAVVAPQSNRRSSFEVSLCNQRTLQLMRTFAPMRGAAQVRRSRPRPPAGSVRFPSLPREQPSLTPWSHPISRQNEPYCRVLPAAMLPRRHVAIRTLHCDLRGGGSPRKGLRRRPMHSLAGCAAKRPNREACAAKG